MGKNVSRKLADAFGGEHTWDSREVHRDRNLGPLRLCAENCAHVVCGIVAELEDQDASVAQQVARLVNQALVHFDAGGSAEERAVRFVVAHFALQLRGFAARDVRRVAYD